MTKTILECITRGVVIGGVLVLGLGAAAMIYNLFKIRKMKNNKKIAEKIVEHNKKIAEKIVEHNEKIVEHKMKIVEHFLQDPRVTKVQVGDSFVVERVLEKKGFNTGVTVAKHIEENHNDLI